MTPDQQEGLDKYIKLMDNFLRMTNQEFTSHTRVNIVRMLDDVYHKGKTPAFAMEEIFWYLNDAYPELNHKLYKMENLCQSELSKLEAI